MYNNGDKSSNIKMCMYRCSCKIMHKKNNLVDGELSGHGVTTTLSIDIYCY